MKNLLKYFSQDYIPKQFWLYLVLALILSIGLGIWEGPNIGALIFTAVFIAWYSIETRNLVKEMKLTNALSVQPVLVLDYIRELHGWEIKLRNIGKGAAIDICLFVETGPYKTQISKHILAADEDVVLRVYKKNEAGKFNTLVESAKDFKSEALSLRIEFKDTLKSNLLEARAVIHNPPKIEMTI